MLWLFEEGCAEYSRAFAEWIIVQLRDSGPFNINLLYYSGDSCKHWVQYCEAMETREQWAEKLVNEFQSKMAKHGEKISSAFSKTTGKDSPFKKRPGNPKYISFILA